MSKNQARLTIDLHAIVHNYRVFQEIAPTAHVAAVVKADAYGMGAIPVTQALVKAGCTLFFVAYLHEGIALRDAGITTDIAVFNGSTDPAYIAHNLVPVLNRVEDAMAYQGKAIYQMETGMNRSGFVLNSEQISEPYMVMSHMACADEPKHPLNQQQHHTFKESVAAFPYTKASLCASAAALHFPEMHYDVIRPGIGLYGGIDDSRFRQVMKLEAPILETRIVKPGEGVGYSASYISNSEQYIATLGIGYADGYPRHLSNIGKTYIEGKEAPLAGRVSMDLLTVRSQKELISKQCAEIYGEHYSIIEASRDANTIPYEILTSLVAFRGERVYIG